MFRSNPADGQQMRNDWSGEVGYEIVPRQALTVSALGRAVPGGQTALKARPPPSTRRHPFVWRKGVLNGYSSTRVSLWDSLMFGRLAMGFANVTASRYGIR